MKEYAIVELENDKKYLIIDSLTTANKEYFMITEVMGKEISEEYIVCLYDSNNNCFKKIENIEELELIKYEFEEQIKNKSIFEEQIGLGNFVELKIIDINNYDYTFKYEGGKKIVLNIEFYFENKPKINDFLYISRDVLNENNLLQYGYIKDLNKINNTEIIKVVSSDKEYYYQRFYG